MADIKLSVESGEKEVELVNAKRNLSVTVLVAVYDVFFMGRVMETAEKLDELQRELQARTPKEPEKFMEFYRYCREVDGMMRKAIDELFGQTVCDAILPDVSMFAIGNGAPAWANILYSVIDHMDDGLVKEKETAQARIRKYSAKYKK